MTELPLGADGYLDMDSVPDDDLDEAETADLFVEPDPVPDAVWSRMLSTAVTDTDADVDDLVPPPAAGAGSFEPDSDDSAYDPGYDPAYDDPGYGSGVADAGGAESHDWHDDHVDTGDDGVHDDAHDTGWHDGSY
ncbi:hypothetical protein PSU4_38430 [Pseudonocardia sulfidoxydans NBRC 16205]|uniref:DUF5709 domain-containing protein n=1 Tax=Pseudonocardia sulfidoxydans NBRC 16205 TaxID=1223511 RepID=A0A511DJA2_9PSEU|nr:hypothetical protein [Pseudonocardia sulfidoxydans]GEL24889.1 hypothetical protein PSU4_38430 [Pseudonocardia sulfidoxydans NBRC 16205]